MLDPNSYTRISLKGILSHPWMTNLCKSEASGCLLKTSDNICKEVKCVKKCNCSCHSTLYSVLTQHCVGCMDTQACNSEIMSRRKITNSESIQTLGNRGGRKIEHLGKLSPINLPYHNPQSYQLSSIKGQQSSEHMKNSSGGIVANSTIVVMNSLKLNTSSEEEENDEDILYV